MIWPVHRLDGERWLDRLQVIHVLKKTGLLTQETRSLNQMRWETDGRILCREASCT
jgi:hypothetical protein